MYVWKVFSDYKRIIIQIKYCLKVKKKKGNQTQYVFVMCLCVNIKKNKVNISYMQNYELASETGEIKEVV